MGCVEPKALDLGLNLMGLGLRVCYLGLRV